MQAGIHARNKTRLAYYWRVRLRQTPVYRWRHSCSARWFVDDGTHVRMYLNDALCWNNAGAYYIWQFIEQNRTVVTCSKIGLIIIVDMRWAVVLKFIVVSYSSLYLLLPHHSSNYSILNYDSIFLSHTYMLYLETFTRDKPHFYAYARNRTCPPATVGINAWILTSTHRHLLSAVSLECGLWTLGKTCTTAWYKTSRGPSRRAALGFCIWLGDVFVVSSWSPTNAISVFARQKEKRRIILHVLKLHIKIPTDKKLWLFIFVFHRSATRQDPSGNGNCLVPDTAATVVVRSREIPHRYPQRKYLPSRNKQRSMNTFEGYS